MINLPFKARYEIGQLLLKDNPTQKKEIAEWVCNQSMLIQSKEEDKHAKE